MKKTGHLFLQNVPFTDHVKSDLYIPPKKGMWQLRLSKAFGHEPQVVRWYERNLRADDVVFDVGAHMGYFGTLVSKLQPSVQFHGFEANWFIAHYLKLNQGINDPGSKWHITEKFVGSRDSREWIAIDTYMQTHAAPTIFQMDVDGEEINVLSGAKKLLDAATSIFLVEVHPKDLKERNQSEAEFVALFNTDKYELRFLPDLRNENSEWSDNISAQHRTEEYYLLAAPKGKMRL
ncbi:MAG: hypothetical protein ACKVOR_08090 [Flavobacteriales bacterium]